MRKTRQQDFKNVDLLTAKKLGDTQEVRSDDILKGVLEQKQMTRQLKREKRKRLLLRLLVVLIVCAAVFLFLKSSYFNVTDIKVEGMDYYSGQEIVSMSVRFCS